MKAARILMSLATIATFGLAVEASLAQSEYAPQDFADCMIDMATHCGDVRPGGGRFIKCLQDHRADLSDDCRAVVIPSDYPDSNEGVTITVTVDKIRAKKGVVIVSLCDDPPKFPQCARRMSITPASSDTVVVTFSHLKPNQYAITAFHDENENGRLDATTEGRPEGGGVSNGPPAGAPSFAASAVKVTGDTKLTVSLRYL